MMTEHEDIIERLRRVGPEPVPPATASAHLTAMALAKSAPPRRFRRAAIASTAFAGFILGSTGLAAAGALPGAVQGVAHDALAQVSIEVPDRRGDSDSDVTRPAQDADGERTQAVDEHVRTGECGTAAEPRQPSTAGDADGRVDDTEPRTNDTDPRGTEPGWVDPEPTEEELAARLEQRASADCTDDGIERDGATTAPDREAVDTTREPADDTTDPDREAVDATREPTAEATDPDREAVEDADRPEGTDAARP